MEKATGPRFLSPSVPLGSASAAHDLTSYITVDWTAVTDEYVLRVGQLARMEMV